MQLELRLILRHVLRPVWVFVAVAIALAVTPSARAVELKIDFGVGDVPEFVSTSPNDVQAGFSDFAVDATEDGVAGIVDLAAVPSGVASRVFSGVTVGVESDDLAFFDAPDEDHPLGDLGEDGVFGEADVFVRLTDLPVGGYQINTYHYGSELIIVATSGDPIEIFLDAGDGESQVASAFFPSIREMVAIGIPFAADGTQDVVVRLSGSALINGFTLIPVPEPASWLLLGWGIAALVGAEWRRRYKRVPPVQGSIG